MKMFSLATNVPEAPIQVLKGVWGPVGVGQEPWRGILVKSRVMPGTSLAYDRSKGEVLAISLHEGGWYLRMFKESPYTVEEALRRGTSFPHSWEVVYHGHDVVDAAGALVRWCLS